MELVVARYDEDLSWLPPGVKCTVYNKGTVAVPGAVALPNVGREAHTYAHHIATHYDALSDVVVFTQGRWADHVPAEHMEAMLRGHARAWDVRWLDQTWDETIMGSEGWTPEDNYTRTRMQPAGMTLGAFYTRYIDPRLPPRESVMWWPGAIFSARRSQIHSRPRAAYAALAAVLAAGGPNPETAHYMERFWASLLSSSQ